MPPSHKRNKNLILNPMETEWTRDTNKLGYRMLLGMGWSPGKGLGAQEQGITRSVRVSTKYIDGRGLGDKPVQPLLVVQQYDQILKELNHKKEDGNLSLDQLDKEEPLPNKRKYTTTRFHMKFTKAKDVKSFTTSDMRGIFGFVENELHEES